MSLDFDSAALQMQHEDEEYDPEDYAREQELQQLLTDLPHDMLEDSGDHLSNYSDCGTPEEHEQVHEPWDQDASRWNDHPVATNPQTDYNKGQNRYAERFIYDEGNIQGEMHGNDWPDHHNEEEDKSMYEISGRASEDEADDVHIRGDGYNAPNHYQQNHVYHLPENFRPYANGHQQEFNNQHSKANFIDAKKEHMKFGTSDTANSQSSDPYKVIYKPYPNNIQQSVPISPDGTRRNEVFEEMQQEFLATGSSDSMQILQLQVLNKAKDRQLEEFNKQLEERSQQMRYLSHQLAMVKDEKDGMCLSLQESQKLYQSSKEKEIQLEGQLKALEKQIQTLTANEAQLVKHAKGAEVAMESLQQQLLELRRSDALLRAREQHEAIIAALKQENEAQVSSLQQKLDAKHSALQEQTEFCCHLKEQVKQLERTLEESKLEKTEIINRLSRSLEESQNQCANLLQTGFVQETNQLRIQLQQAQSAQLISDEMNNALQEELKELKEEIVLYESAAKYGVFLSDPGGELNVGMTDSYVDLGIKKVNENTRLHRAGQNKELDNELPKDEIILELKAELERLLNSNKAKRNRVSQLQDDLKDCERTIEDLKQQQVKAMHETKGRNVDSPSLLSNTEEILKLKKENQILHEEAKSYSACIQELKEKQEKLKKANQDLCNQMRQMVQDSDRDKQEALDRCERLYRQHYEDMKRKYFEELEGNYVADKQKLIHAYEGNVTKFKTEIAELNKEMIAVKEDYIAVCKERDDQEAILKAAFEQEQQLKEEKLKKQSLEEKEDSLNKLKTELEETYKNSIVTAKSQWQKEKELDTMQLIESEVATIKACWEREHNEIKDQAIQKIEKEWQRRLDQALEETRRNVAESKDGCSQTEQVTIIEEPLSQVIAKAVDKQALLVQEALKEKENALREQEARHHENIARQVELTLTKARARWLQELPELEEYKIHLKAAQEKWEKECEIRTAKEVSQTLSAAEEKWKKELENAEKARVRTKELEERVLSLKRELELKEEEIPAVMKAELAKARTEWNKEKQEEVLRIQHQNEKDYHSFLHDHKNKINEVLAKAKEEFAKQKQELLDQKEAELKICLARQQQEWAVHEAKRFQNEVRQYEDRILVQTELLLDEMHKDLIRCASDERTWRAKWNAVAPAEINLPFKEKLKFCLQKAYRGTVYAILEKAKQEWNELQKHEDLDHNFKDREHSCIRHGEEETGDKVRPAMFDIGKQVELQRLLRKQPALQRTEMDTESECKRRGLLSQVDPCCERCRQQLERKERECQDLKKKLDKACRHLQLAVKEQKAKSEIQENEKNGDENSSMKNKPEHLKPCYKPPRASSEGSVSEPFVSCDGKALEEMRSQYLKAVGKIKSDMIRYVHESKERAAEIIKAEVLRERQETARKMRKYYLICLQQLLIDDGKHEGAEKKIICAAGKLATMAKILETPVRSPSQSKASHSALSHISKLLSGGEESKRNGLHQPQPALTESLPHGESIGQTNSHPASQKRIPCCLRPQLDAESQPALTSSTQVGGRSFKQLGDPSGGTESLLAHNEDKNADGGPLHSVNTAALQDPLSHPSQVKPRNIQPASSTHGSSDPGTSSVRFMSHHERPDVKELGCLSSTRHPKTVCEKTQASEIQETPVRDDGSSTDWSLVSETLHLDSNDVFLYPVQKAYSRTPVGSCEQLPMTGLFSYTMEEASVLGQHTGSYKDKAVVKSPVTNYSKGHLAVNPSHAPHLSTDRSSPASAQQSAGLGPTLGKSYNLLHSRKRIQDAKAFQQDSGFDSPQINFD